MKRRLFLTTALGSAVSISAFLASCANQAQAATTLAQAQAYANDLNGALQAAGQSIVNTGKLAADQVAQATQDLVSLAAANSAFQAAQAASDVKSIALQVLSFLQRLSPVLAPFTGGAAPFISIGIAVIQAFINGLPLPAGAPPSPPAALHRAALAWHRK